MKKPISFSNFSEADTHKTQDGKTAKKGLWYNINQRKKKGLSPKKPGSDGYPKTLDIEGTEGYVSNAQRAAVWANRADGGKGHPDNKKKSKKEAYEPITTKRSQALAKADAEPKKPVTLPKAPWDKGTKANTKGTNVTYDKNGNVVKEGAMKRISTGDGLDTYKPKPKEIKSAFNARAIVKKDRQGSGKPMAGGSDAHKAAVKKYVSGMKSNRPGNTLPRQMKDPKKDAMVSKDGKVKVVDKDLEKAHLARGYVRAEHMISKELYMKTENVKSADKKAEKYTKPDGTTGIRMVAVDKDMIKTENMRLINKMKKASPAAKKALEAPSRVGLTIADIRKATEKAKKRQEKERQATGKTSTSTTDLAARSEAVQVDEVSQKTLTSYIKKASDELEKGKVKDVNKIGNRAVGIDTAVHGIRKNAAKGKTIKGTIGAPKNVPEANENTVDEALDMKQRLARGRSARKNKSKLAMGRKKAGRRIASMKVLKKRARRAARKTLTKRLTKGIAKSDLSVSRKREIEKRLDKPAFKIKANRLVKRTIKDIRKKEIARKRK